METLEFRNITPEIAKEMLKNNENNRSLRPSTIERYALDMKTDNWEESNCSPIVIDENGNLKDGQHRLNAVIRSGKTIRFLVISNVDQYTHIFDRNGIRTTADIAKLAGYTELNKRMIDTAKGYFRRLVAAIPACNKVKKYTDEVVIQYSLERQEELAKASNYCINGTHGLGLNTNTSAYRTVSYVALLAGISDDKVKRFFKVLSTGFYENDSEKVIIALRNRIISDRDKGIKRNGYDGADELVSLVEKTLFSYVKNENKGYLRTTSFIELTKKAYKADIDILEKVFKGR